MKKVAAVCDLWSDGGDRLLVLAGTTGMIIGRESAKDGLPPAIIVSFSDGVSTFCMADEIVEV